jgi:amidase
VSRTPGGSSGGSAAAFAAGLDVDEEARPDIKLWENLRIWTNIHDDMMAGKLPLWDGYVEQQKEQQALWAEFFKRYDVLLAPVSPTAAFPHNHHKPMASRSLTVNGRSKSYWNNLTWTVMAIVSGLPATVAPVGRTESGLPVGVQIIGDRFEDRTTIDFARGLSEIIGGFVAPPGYKK